MSTILDPTNKGKNQSAMFDPGGAIVKKLTGSNIAQRVADPLNINQDTSTVSKKEKSMLSGIRSDGQEDAARILNSPRKTKKLSLIKNDKLLV